MIAGVGLSATYKNHNTSHFVCERRNEDDITKI